MAFAARLAYVENEILQADPIRLIQMLYRGAIEAVAKARGHLREANIQDRSRQITKAAEIINELTLSLDREKGGEIAANLAELYDYLQRLLQDANFRQVEEPLAEAGRLLSTLQEAWAQCTPPVSTHPPTPEAAKAQPRLPYDANPYSPPETGTYY